MDNQSRKVDERRSKRAAAALALASGGGIAETAAAVGCHRKTLNRWTLEPAFMRHVARLRATVLSQALGRLTAATVAAADTLVALLGDPSPKIRLAAAQCLLLASVKLRAECDVDQRLSALEARTTTGPRLGELGCS